MREGKNMMGIIKQRITSEYNNERNEGVADEKGQCITGEHNETNEITYINTIQ